MSPPAGAPAAETAAPVPASPPSSSSSTPTASPKPSGGWDRLVEKYRRDHRHPVNHWLHVGVGWPMVGASLLLLPFRPLWSAGLFLGGYATMFTGHFVFEKNTPTILKHPSTPFVIAWAVIKNIVRPGRAASFLKTPDRSPDGKRDESPSPPAG